MKDRSRCQRDALFVVCASFESLPGKMETPPAPTTTLLHRRKCPTVQYCSTYCWQDGWQLNIYKLKYLIRESTTRCSGWATVWTGTVPQSVLVILPFLFWRRENKMWSNKMVTSRYWYFCRGKPTTVASFSFNLSFEVKELSLHAVTEMPSQHETLTFSKHECASHT